jgi:hypothetical protein
VAGAAQCHGCEQSCAEAVNFPVPQEAQRAAMEFIFTVRDDIQEGLDIGQAIEARLEQPFR